MSDVTDRLDKLEAALKANQIPATLAALQRKLEATWQPDAGVLLQAGSITGDTLADATVQDAKLRRREVWGVFSAAGAILVAGSADWSVVRNGVSDYTITFSPVFAAVPCVTSQCESNTANLFSQQNLGTTATSTRILVRSDAGTATDSIIHFRATGTR